MTATSRRLLACVVQILLVLLTLAILLMWGLSYHLYTSVGIDLEEAEGTAVRRTCFRVRWPGNGGIWFGAEAYPRPLHLKRIEAFDPACSAWRTPQHLPEPESLWNRLGFWWMMSPETDPSNPLPLPRLEWGIWCGVPAWLPAILTGFWPLRCGLRAWRKRRGCADG
jgi:hypothetical protein